jgi:hypothetical protein
VRDIFVRLTRLDEEALKAEERRDTRQRVGMDELTPAANDPADTKALVKRLADSRLLVTGVNGATSREEVEVGHEALIRYWPRLRSWLDEDRTTLRLREGIREAAREWGSGGKEETLLVHRGLRLLEAETLRGHRTIALNELEQAYVEACTALREREKGARDRLRRRVTSGLALGLVIALVLAGWALFERRDALMAKNAAVKAEANAVNAEIIAVAARDEATKQAKLATRSVENNLVLYLDVCRTAAEVVGTPNLNAAKEKLHNFIHGGGFGEHAPLIRSLAIARALDNLMTILENVKAPPGTGLVDEDVGQASLALVEAAINTWSENLKRTNAVDKEEARELQKQLMRKLTLEDLCRQATEVTYKIAAADSLDKAQKHFPDLERLYWAELYWIELDEREWRPPSADGTRKSKLEEAMVHFRGRLILQYQMPLEKHPLHTDEEPFTCQQLAECAAHVRAACAELLKTRIEISPEHSP